MTEPFFSDEDLTIFREEGRGYVLYRLTGRFVRHVEPLHGDVKAGSGKRLVFDLSGLTNTNSHFVGLLALAHSVDGHREVSLVGPSRLLRDILEITGMDSLVRIHDSVEAAR